MALALSVFSLCAVGCEEDAPPSAGSTVASTTAAPEAPTTAPDVPAIPTAAASIKAPRPLPIGSSGPIQPSAPPEDQMMAINYTIAMVGVLPQDPPIVDKAYVEGVLPKLTAAARAAGGAKISDEPARSTKGGRKLETDVATCTSEMPTRLLKSAGSSIQEAYDAGVLAISCRGQRWQCHQSTRNPDDVLCHAAPR